jgi:SAM-dependent methyltransferase
MPELSADYFDNWYSAALASAHDGEVSCFLGLPDGVRSNSSLPGRGLDEIARLLQLSGSHDVIDLGCGRGQLRLELVRRTGCDITGVDFSSVAITAAREQLADCSANARFVVGDMTQIGLATDCADVVVSIDALYFPRPLSAVTEECRRLLRPEGQLIASGWEPTGREPRMRTALESAGFADIAIEDRPEWAAIERYRWLRLLEIDNADDDLALAADQAEAGKVLSEWQERRRVLVTATAP